METNHFASNLKYLRKKYNIEQLELAEKLGRKSSSSISEWEKGRYTPKAGILNDIAQIFNVPLTKLMNENLALKSETPIDNIVSICSRLEEKRQNSVLNFATLQLNDQNSTASTEETPYNIYKTLPVRGIEASKNGQWHDENITMDMQLPTNLIPENYNDIVIILGDSMRPHLEHGEILFIQTDDEKANLEIEEGQLGLFNTSEGIFIKKYRHHYLESLNSEFKHVFFKDDDQLKTLGVVVKTIKNNTYN